MKNGQDALIQLRSVLADLYADETSARRVSADANLPLNAIDFSGNSLNRWYKILNEAQKHKGGIEELIDLAQKDYLDNPALKIACNAYCNSVETLKKGDHVSDSLHANSENLNTLKATDIFIAAQKLAPESPKGIQRTRFNTELQNFIESSARYAVITGPAGVGKSVVMNMQACALLKDGWTTFLMNGTAFSLDYLAEWIANDGLGYTSEFEWRQVLVTPWQSKPPEQVKGMVLLLDEVDRADMMSLSRELTRLHNAINHIPESWIKIIVSCNDLLKIQQYLPFLTGSKTLANPATSDLFTITITDFNQSELREALVAIGATDLTRVRQPGEFLDPYIEALYELLRHPTIFGLYANIYTSVDISSGISWGDLLAKYFQLVLERTEKLCKRGKDFIQEQLIKLVQLMREHQSNEFRLDKDLLRTQLSELRVDDVDPTCSPYAALRQLSLLTESDLPAGKRAVRFAFTDAASYLLSFILEREIQQIEQTDEAIEETISAWLDKAYNYPSLIDGLLIWVDRLAINPQNRLLHILLSKLIEGQAIRLEVAFRLIQPAVLEALFEMVAQKTLDGFYHYEAAASALRFSTEMGKKARRQLHNRNPQVQQLALHYLGQQGDISLVADLIDILEDDDKAINDNVYSAIAKIGEPALKKLLDVVVKPSESIKRRERCLGSVRVIGVRNKQVSIALESCLQEGITTSNSHLLRSTLLSAAALRDKAQISYAINALTINDWQIVCDAAKLLTETSAIQAISALQAAVQRLNASEASSLWRDMAASQVLAALASAADTQSRQVVLQNLENSIRGKGIVPLLFALSIAKKWQLFEADSFVLEILEQALETDPSGNSAIRGFMHLGESWRPDNLATLVQTRWKFENEGKSIAKSIVNAIVASEQPDSQNSLHDHRLRSLAFYTLVKCQPSDFTDEAVRLLECPGRWRFDLDVCKALWIMADVRAEAALIRKFQQMSAEKSSSFFEFEGVLRALGTCGGERSAVLILDYLSKAETVGLYIPEECLCPLIYRNHLSPNSLVAVARNPQAAPNGRTAALVALGIINARGYQPLFGELLQQQRNLLSKRTLPVCWVLLESQAIARAYDKS